MKKILLLSLALLSINSVASEVKGSVSTMISRRDSLYKGREILPLPIWANLKYENLYLQGSEIGAKFLDKDNFDAFVFAQLQDGHSIKGSRMNPGYSTINRRSFQQSIGLKADIKFKTISKDVTLSPYFSLGKRGAIGGAKLSTFFMPVERLVIVPSVSSNIYSEKYTDYYFGVDKNEIGGNITKEYSPKMSYSVSANLYGEFYFTKSLSAFAFIDVTKYGSEVTKSPIVENKLINKTGLGLKYTF